MKQNRTLDFKFYPLPIFPYFLIFTGARVTTPGRGAKRELCLTSDLRLTSDRRITGHCRVAGYLRVTSDRLITLLGDWAELNEQNQLAMKAR